MTVKFEESSTTSDQVETLIDLCRKAPWENVQRITVWAGARKGDPVIDGTIQHIERGDGKVHDDPTIDIRAYVERCKAKQKERKKPTAFIFSIIGVRVANVRGRKKVEDPALEEFFTHVIRIGDGEEKDEEESSTPVDGMKVVASMVKDLQGSYTALIAAERERSEYLWGKFQQVMQTSTDMGAHQVEMAKVVAGAAKDERQERREAERERRQEERDDADAHARRAYNIQMMSKLESLATRFASIIQASRVANGEAAPSPPEPGSDGTLAGDLRELLKRITPEEQSQLRAKLGHDLWNLVLAASRASDDDGARAVLRNLREYVKANPSLGSAIFDAGAIIEGERYQRLLEILKRGGAFNKD